MISPSIILPFDGAHADIPAGFTRETTLDGKFIKGKSAGIGGTGGANSHTQTSAHTHSVSAHAHAATGQNERDATNVREINKNVGKAVTGHSHPSGATGAATAGTTGSTTINLTSSSNVPSYYDVIFIKSTSYNIIPANGMIFSVDARSGLTFHSASNGKFLRGAGTGANAGGTGGADTHTHTQSHTHTANAHGHGTGGINGYTGDQGEGGTGSDNDIQGAGHSHSFTVGNGTQAMNSNSTSSSSGSNIPYNKTLGNYKASALTPLKKGDIALTTEEDVPIGWLLCDGTNDTIDLDGFYVKNNATSGTTTGSNTHNHTVAHTHTGSGTHTHTPSTSAFCGTAGGYNHSAAVTYVNGVGDHRHYVDVAASTTSYASTTATTNTESNEPEYVEAKYIQFEFAIGGGSFLLNLI